MTDQKKNDVCRIIDNHVAAFADTLRARYRLEVDDPNGVINLKKNNAFINTLGSEFTFYSAFVRSFDSAFGKVLENVGNEIAKISFEVRHQLSSFLLPQQTQHIDFLMTAYEKRDSKPAVSDYQGFTCLIPTNKESYKRTHQTDNYFYDQAANVHYLIELKSGGDLDNKKAKSEKIALLNEYFILKNSLYLLGEENPSIRLFFATAYNKNGEGNEWRQERVRTFFSPTELLIGKDYWNFVCNDPQGFDILIEQYQKSAQAIQHTLDDIKKIYFH